MKTLLSSSPYFVPLKQSENILLSEWEKTKRWKIPHCRGVNQRIVLEFVVSPYSVAKLMLLENENPQHKAASFQSIIKQNNYNITCLSSNGLIIFVKGRSKKKLAENFLI